MRIEGMPFSPPRCFGCAIAPKDRTPWAQLPLSKPRRRALLLLAVARPVQSFSASSPRERERERDSAREGGVLLCERAE